MLDWEDQIALNVKILAHINNNNNNIPIVIISVMMNLNSYLLFFNACYTSAL